MMKSLFINYRINFLVILHLVAFISLIFPYGFPLFSIVTILYFTFALINKDVSIKINVYTIMLYLVVLAYVIGINNSKGIIYNYARSDLVNIVLITLIILSTSKYSINEYKKVIHKTLVVFGYIAPLLAFVSLYKYYLLLNNKKIAYFEIPGRPYPWGTSLMPDYNMFALGMIIGLISLAYLIKQSNNFAKQTICVVLGLIVFTTIIFSGSRRGWIVLIIAGLFFMHSLLIMVKNNTIKNNVYLSVVIIIFVLLLTVGFKDNFDISITNQNELDKIEYRYSTLENIGESLNSRTSRLEYGIELVSEFDIVELIIGDGFSYLKLYGEKYSGQGAEDYPHNPLLSSLLYSGLLGLFFTTLFTLIPFIRTVKNREVFHLEYYFIYIVVLLFLIQSTNSIFSTNILWLILIHFCLIPLRKKKDGNYNEGSIGGVKPLYK